MLVVSGCQQYDPPSAVDAFYTCVQKQIPGKLKISSAVADAAVSRCDRQLRKGAAEIVGTQFPWNRGRDARQLIEDYKTWKFVMVSHATCARIEPLPLTCYRTD
jgi:hypothetical protein